MASVPAAPSDIASVEPPPRTFSGWAWENYAAALQATGLTQLHWSAQLWFSWPRPYLKMLREVLHLDGDVIECGVFSGRTLLRTAAMLGEMGCRKAVHGCDSFDGFPPEQIGEVDLGAGRSLDKVRGRFRHAHAAIEQIQNAAVDLDADVRLHVGYFEETLPRLPLAPTFCFAHIDCDIYESYLTCLRHLYPRMVPGGVLLFDEYDSEVWPGATKAIDAFFADKPETIACCEDESWLAPRDKHYVIKQ